MPERKRIAITVDTELTDGQIESHGATLYLLEPEGECHGAIKVEVLDKNKAPIERDELWEKLQEAWVHNAKVILERDDWRNNHHALNVDLMAMRAKVDRYRALTGRNQTKIQALKTETERLRAELADHDLRARQDMTDEELEALRDQCQQELDDRRETWEDAAKGK